MEPIAKSFRFPMMKYAGKTLNQTSLELSHGLAHKFQGISIYEKVSRYLNLFSF